VFANDRRVIPEDRRPQSISQEFLSRSDWWCIGGLKSPFCLGHRVPSAIAALLQIIRRDAEIMRCINVVSH